jgi:hypothetical protein
LWSEKRETKEIKEVEMYKLIAVTIGILGILCMATLINGHDSAAERIGQMPTVVVTAARYDAGSAWTGLLDTVVVNAAPTGQEDVAWAGLQDTVTATEVPLPVLRGSTAPTLTYKNPLGVMIDNFHPRVE